MTQTSKTRGLHILVAAVLIELCLGTGLGWSLFVRPLMDLHGWTRSQVTFTLSVSLLFNGLGYFLIGYWADHYPRRMSVLGGLLFGFGIAASGLAALSGWRYLMYACYGMIGGFAISLPYLSALSAAIKWFPHRRGMVAGIVIMGCGTGAVLVGFLAPSLRQRFGPGMTLFGMGVVFMLVCGVLGFVIRNPPGQEPPADRPSLWRLIPVEAFGYKRFWGLWTIQLISMSAGLGLLSQAALLAMEQQRLDLPTAGKLVALMAICNGLGRLFWPSLSDRFGRRQILLVLFLGQGLVLAAITHIGPLWLFAVALCYLPFCYGGNCGVLPAFTADLFGTDKVGRMYGPVISAQSVAGLVGPLLFSNLRQSTGSYTLPTHIVGIVLLLACVLPAIVGRKTLSGGERQHKRTEEVTSCCRS